MAAKKLESETVPLTKLFSQDFFFRIPEYQRPFLWDSEDFTNLIEDLSAAQRDTPYFLGTIVLHKNPHGEYDVVDGQQRLTALCILLACMRDILSTGNADKDLASEIHEKIYQAAKKLDSIPARNRVQVKDQHVYNSMIGKIGGSTTKYVEVAPKDSIGSRYEEARAIFWAKLQSMSEQEREEFAIFVTQYCTFIYVATDTFEDAFRLFTVVNDRGKQLRRIDVLKAYNLDPAYVTSADARTKYASRWEDMENRLGEAEFENIFSLLRLIYTKDKPQFDLHREFEKKILGAKGMPKRGAEFMDQLERYVDLYDSIFVDRDFLDDPEKPHAAYQTLMEAMTLHFSASEWKACVLAFAEKFDRADFYSVTLAIEKLYLEHWVTNTRKDERYGAYTEILKRIEAADSPREVIASINTNTREIQEACRADNFYTAGHSKYLLVRAEILACELDHPRHFQVRSVEHVLPQTPREGGTWAGTFDEESRRDLTNSAGNLVLLSKSKNSKASNREFEEKKSTYLRDRVTAFPRSAQVLGYEQWTPEVIRQRTEEFARRVLDDPK